MEITMQFYKGQKVDYRMLLGGCQRDCGDIMRRWVSGYIVIEPVSPYDKSCVLIDRINPELLDMPFNVAPENLMDTMKRALLD
jgi:hypothetical protein